MKRIAALALIAALGATSASAEEIKPVTSLWRPSLSTPSSMTTPAPDFRAGKF